MKDTTSNKQTRTTIVIRSDLLDQIRAVSYHERTTLKFIIETAIQDYMDTKPDRIKKRPARF